MSEVVADLHAVIAGGDDLAGLVFEPEKVARIIGVAPGALEDLGGEFEDHIGTEIRALASGVDALGVIGLQDVVRCSALLIGMQLLGTERPLVQHDVSSGDTGSRRSIAQVVGREAGVHGRVLELDRRPQAFVHRVD